MQKPKISTMVAVAAITLGIAGASAGLIHAASLSDTTNNPMSNLVNAIAQKFNLNTADVQQVFDQQHAQMEAQHLQSYKDHLAEAVTTGKITQAQADLIITKQQELQSQREVNRTAMEGKTEEERKAAMKSGMDSLRQWATDNSIPMEYLMFGHGGQGHRGPGFGFNSRPGQSATPNSVTNQ